MAISAKVGSFNIGTGAAGTTTVVSGLGFQPKFILFWWNGLTAASNGTRATGAMGMGWATSTSRFGCATTGDVDATGTSQAGRGQRTDACVAVLASDGSWGAGAGWADLQSFDADGFTLEILDAFTTGNLYVTYLAFGGSSITNVECGVFTAAGVAPTNQTVNNVDNFQPDITLLLSAPIAADAPSAANDSGLMFGVGRGTTEYVWGGGADAAATTGKTASWCHSGELVAFHVTDPTVAHTNRAEFVSHNAGPGGFTINWLERGDAHRILWCSIKGGDWTIGDFLTQTDTSTQIVESAFASPPSAVLVVSAGRAATTPNATPPIHSQWSLGAATSASERAVQYMDSRQGNTTMFIHLAARADAIYCNTDPAQTNYTEVGRGDLVSMDATGFTAIMDDADPSQAFAWYVAVGATAAATVVRDVIGCGVVPFPR